MPLLDTYLAQKEAEKRKKAVTSAATSAAKPATAPAVTTPNLAQLNRVDAGPVAPSPGQSVAQANTATAPPPPATGGTRADVEASVRTKKPQTLAEMRVAEQAAAAVEKAIQQAIASLTPPTVAQSEMPPVTTGPSVPSSWPRSMPPVATESVTTSVPSSWPITGRPEGRSIYEVLGDLVKPQMPPVSSSGKPQGASTQAGLITPPSVETTMPPVTLTREGIAGAGAAANLPDVASAGVTGIPYGTGGGMGGGQARAGAQMSGGQTGPGIATGPMDPNYQGGAYEGGLPPGMGQGLQSAEMGPRFDLNEYRQSVTELFHDLYSQNVALAEQLWKQWNTDMSALESQIMQMFQAQGSEVDPATKAALAELRTELDRRIGLLKEDLNRRGLLQSGIAVKDELRMLSGGMSEEEKLLAVRLADLQNRATDAMMQFAQARLNAMSSMAQNQMQMSQYWAGQRLALEKDIASREDQWTRWWEEQKAQARREAEQQRQWQEEQRLREAGVTGTYQGQPTLEARTLEEQRKRWEAEQRLREAGLTGVYQGQPTLEARRAERQPSQPEPSWTERAQMATGNAMQSVLSARQQGYNRQQVEEMLRDWEPTFRARGVDMDAVRQYLYSLPW